MATKRASVDEIQNAIDEFVDGLPELGREQYEKAYALLKDLSLDSEGKIKPTIENLKVIDRVKRQLSSLVDNPLYQDKVVALDAALEHIAVVQTNYFAATFKDFTKPKTVPKLRELAFDNTVDQLTHAGVNEYVVNPAVNVVRDHVTDGSSFAQMVDELKATLLGTKEVEPKMISYAKQTITDTFSGFSRNYHNIVTADLGLDWFEYIGALVDSSRPFCIALVAKHYVHRSELASIAAGVIDGVPVSRAGLFPGTTGATLLCNCGGYNCTHQLIPVPEVTVPEEIRLAHKKAKDLPKAKPKDKPAPPAPPKKKEFIPAKTSHEAEAYSKSIGVKHASWKGIDVEMANTWNKTLTDTMADFPELKMPAFGNRQEIVKVGKAKVGEFLKGTETYQRYAKVDQMMADRFVEARQNSYFPRPSGEIASNWKIGKLQIDGKTFDVGAEFNGVLINTNAAKKESVLIEIGKRNMATQWFAQGADKAPYIANHELGHELDRLIDLRRDPDFIEVFKRFRAKGEKDFVGGLSRYAYVGKNMDVRMAETIAEAWAEYRTVENPREMAKEIGELLIRKYKLKFTK